MADRPGICGGYGDMDYPHAFIWCHDYKPKQQAVSRQIPTIQLRDCGQEAFEPTAHHPDDVAEIVKLRVALQLVTRELDVMKRARAEQNARGTDTFTSLMLVTHDK